MEMHAGLTIFAAALGGVLIGWNVRGDLEQRRRTKDHTREDVPSGDVGPGAGADVRGEPAPRAAVNTPPWQRPVLTELPKQ